MKIPFGVGFRLRWSRWCSAPDGRCHVNFIYIHQYQVLQQQGILMLDIYPPWGQSYILSLMRLYLPHSTQPPSTGAPPRAQTRPFNTTGNLQSFEQTFHPINIPTTANSNLQPKFHLEPLETPPKRKEKKDNSNNNTITSRINIV